MIDKMVKGNKFTDVDWLPILRQREQVKRERREWLCNAIRYGLMYTMLVGFGGVSVLSLIAGAFFARFADYPMMWVMLGVSFGSSVLVIGMYLSSDMFRRAVESERRKW